MHNYNIIEYGELDSTNNEAKRLVRAAGTRADVESGDAAGALADVASSSAAANIRADAADNAAVSRAERTRPRAANISGLYGTVVTARRQTAGRGRRGKGFVSSGEDSIYASFILRPPSLPAEQLVTAFAAVAVCEAIEQTTPYKPSVKWVNDILVDGKKVCGILAESIPHATVLGIGVNINMKDADFPPELRGIAGSLHMDADGRARFFHALVKAVFGRAGAALGARVFESESEAVKPVFGRAGGLFSGHSGQHGPSGEETSSEQYRPPSGEATSSGQHGPSGEAAGTGRRALLDAYRARSILIGRRVFVHRGEEKSPAFATGIADDGGLIVLYDDGSSDTLRSGEVSVRLASEPSL